MLISGLVSPGRSSQQANSAQPASDPKPDRTGSDQAGRSTPAESRPGPSGAKPVTRPDEPPATAADPKATAPQSTSQAPAGSSAGQDGLRGAVAEAAALPSPTVGEAPSGAGAEEAARSLAEAARRSAVDAKVLTAVATGPKEIVPPFMTKPVPYGEGSPWPDATSAEPGAARGTEPAVDRAA